MAWLMEPSTLYILNDQGEPEPCPDPWEWSAWMETHQKDKRIAEDSDEGEPDESRKVWVSTVFMGIDHSFTGKGPPILFETLVFGGELDGEMDRYSTRAEALAGHQRMCQRVGAAERRKGGSE